MGNPCWKKRLFAGRLITPAIRRDVKLHMQLAQKGKRMGERRGGYNQEITNVVK
jgi:hypothetical protein